MIYDSCFKPTYFDSELEAAKELATSGFLALPVLSLGSYLRNTWLRLRPTML